MDASFLELFFFLEPPALRTPSPMAQWYCGDCDLTMSISLREIHVNLPKHLSSIPGLWDCVVCEERLRAEDKASHIVSDSHQQCLVKMSAPQIKLTSLEGSSASLCVGGTELSSVRVNQITPSPAPKSRKKPKPVKWKCTICNKKMHESSRLSHEGGKPHLAKLRVSAGRVIPVITTGTSILPTVLPPASPTQSVSTIEPDPPAAAIENPEPITDTPTTKATKVKKGAWTCMICSQSMHESSRAQHERGKRHLARVRNPTVFTTSSTSFSTASSTKPKKTISRKQAKKKKNARPNPQNNVLRPVGSSMSTSARYSHWQNQNGMWTCQICGVSMERKFRAEHEWGDGHLKTLSDLLENLLPHDDTYNDDPDHDSDGDPSDDPSGNEDNEDEENLAFHPNGKRRVEIREVRSLYRHVEHIPLEAYRRAGVRRIDWDTMVTPEHVWRASDIWEDRCLLHGIDTQWGLLPEGGAYKDSDNYFGPSEWDYY